MARPRRDSQVCHEPTDKNRRIVNNLLCAGFTVEDVAEHMRIDDGTLRRYYLEEIQNSKRDRTMILSESLFNDAANGDKQAREFWLKCQGRWSYYKPPEEAPIVTLTTALEQLTNEIKAQNESKS